MSIQVTDENFEEKVLKSDMPVLVDFWAEWCGPCKMLSPILDALAPEYLGKIQIVKMNIDENPKIPSAFGIKSIPTMMIFKGGELMESKVGVHQKPALCDWINGVI
ncbi:MAG: thioredoxin [Rickettsiaceae bacterium]|nr:thioredoxin [Rickettsiaceae bacterium]